MPRAGVYPLASDFGGQTTDDLLSTDPYWVIAVVRLGEPMSFNRAKMASDSSDFSSGAFLRGGEFQAPLVITDDCISLSISMNKSSHTKSLNFVLKQTNVNYLIEVLPGDWVLAWIVNNRDDFNSLVDRIGEVATNNNPKDSCNRFSDGLKFVGRIEDVYKDTHVDPNIGTKTSSYNVRCMGFKELDTYMYYDYALATEDAQGGNFGFMARLGVSVDALFGDEAKEGVQENNINQIIPTLMDLVLGKGPDAEGNIDVDANESGTASVSATPVLAAQHHAKGKGAKDVPYSYLVPIAVGNLLGKKSASKGISSYTDIVELWTGVQSYPTKDGPKMFVPHFKGGEDAHRRITEGGELKGTFLPFMPDFANRPLWAVMQQYVNHAINEMYTALKVNPQGLVVPTVVFRQIPFSTDALVLPNDEFLSEGVEGPQLPDVTPFVSVDKTDFTVTRFLDLPRWHVSPTMVRNVHIGRSNSTRVNFVHIYGTSTYLENGGTPVQYQMLENPPIMDTVDIFRSGIHSYTTTVDCWVDDTVGKAPGRWMALVADWMMGSHLTLNGTIECHGIQSPIAEGDNVSFDGVVYHLMQVDHSAGIDPASGQKHFTTILHLTNGMRDQEGVKPANNQADVEKGLQPIYPGINVNDNTKHDPGLSLEQRETLNNTDKPLGSSSPKNRLDDEPRNEDQIDALARTGVTETPGELL